MNIIVKNKQTSDYLKNLGIYEVIISIRSDEAKYLSIVDDKLTLSNNDNNLAIDFNDQDILNRIDPRSKKCNVIQAVEGRYKNKLQILDTTAGLGRDMITLASRGHSIVAIEKDPYIYLLLLDAIKRAKQIDSLKHTAENITLLNTNSAEYILATDKKFDSVYIDPMFPERKKSAKVKQNMQIMHKIAFDDDTINAQLLDNAVTTKLAKKIVVKRPINAGYLSTKKPSAQIKGKTNRFDIYSLGMAQNRYTHASKSQQVFKSSLNHSSL